jgi:flagella basal body P-ring formation protein FlgA
MCSQTELLQVSPSRRRSEVARSNNSSHNHPKFQRQTDPKQSVPAPAQPLKSGQSVPAQNVNSQPLDNMFASSYWSTANYDKG